MQAKVTIFVLSIAALFVGHLVAGCKKDYNVKQNHILSRLMTDNKLFDPSAASRIESLDYETKATHRIAKDDADWLLSILDASPDDENFTLKSVFIITVLEEVPAESFPRDQKGQIFESGRRILEASPDEDFMRITGGLKLLEKSGDKRGIIIARGYAKNSHWSVRKVSKKTGLALGSNG